MRINTCATDFADSAGFHEYLSAGIARASAITRVSRSIKGSRTSTAGATVGTSSTPSSSTSKMSSALAGIGPEPASPYAS
jgi:hypothetical protein